jgi:hypothetical protein
MPAKILLPPEGKHSSAIVGVNGKLRVVDPPSCKGYQNCCSCKRCTSREGKSIKRPNVVTCRCAHSRWASCPGECFKCGKPMSWTVPRLARQAA